MKPIKPRITYEYTERMRRKWEEKQMKRMLKALITLKGFDLEKIAQHIKPEKDRIAYNEAKKQAIAANFRKVHQEISEIRARLLPQNDVDHEAERLNFIKNNVDNMLSGDLDGFKYDSIEAEMKQKVCYFMVFGHPMRREIDVFFFNLNFEFDFLIRSNQLAASKDEDVVQIEWHELLDRAQEMRSKASRSIFEEKRKAFVEKSVEIADVDAVND